NSYLANLKFEEKQKIEKLIKDNKISECYENDLNKEIIKLACDIVTNSFDETLDFYSHNKTQRIAPNQLSREEDEILEKISTLIEDYDNKNIFNNANIKGRGRVLLNMQPLQNIYGNTLTEAVNFAYNKKKNYDSRTTELL